MSTRSDVKNKLHSTRSSLVKYLTARRMYWTAALMAEVDEWTVYPNTPEAPIASVSIKEKIVIKVREDIVDNAIVFDEPLYDPSKNHVVKFGDLKVTVSGYMIFTIILHELRHIPQVYAEETNATDLYIPKLMELININKDATVKKTKRQLKQIRQFYNVRNIVMDMQLHYDILKMSEVSTGFIQLSNYMAASSIQQLRLSLEQVENSDKEDKEALINKIKSKIEEHVKLYKEKEGGYHGNLCKVEQFDEMFPDPKGDYPINYNDTWSHLLNVAYLRAQDNNESGEGEGEDGEGEGGEGRMDGHEFEGDGSDKEKREKQRRLEKAMRGAAAGGDALQRSSGQGGDAGDASIFVKEQPINYTLIRLISKIKTCINLLHKPTKYSQTWTVTRRRGAFCIPSERQIAETKNQCAIALVLDTSGSMWSEEILNASYSVSKSLHRAGKLGGLYYGDTTIYKVDLSKAVPSVVKGGGGTELDVSHVKLIREDLQLKTNQILDIVYVTDGQVCLREILDDKMVKLHLIINNGGELSLIKPDQVKERWGR